MTPAYAVSVMKQSACRRLCGQRQPRCVFALLEEATRSQATQPVTALHMHKVVRGADGRHDLVRRAEDRWAAEASPNNPSADSPSFVLGHEVEIVGEGRVAERHLRRRAALDRAGSGAPYAVSVMKQSACRVLCSQRQPRCVFTCPKEATRSQATQ